MSSRGLLQLSGLVVAATAILAFLAYTISVCIITFGFTGLYIEYLYNNPDVYPNYEADGRRSTLISTEHWSSCGLLQLTGLVVAATAILAFLAYTISVWLMHMKYSHIPGPKRSSFFLGNLPEIRDRFSKGSTFCSTLFDWCTEYGDTFVMFIMNEAKVFTTDPQAVKDVLVTENFPKPKWPYEDLRYLFNRRFAGYGIITVQNQHDWAVLRNIMNPAFNRKLLKPLMCDFNQVSDDFMAKLANLADGHTVVHLMHYLHRTTLDIIGKVGYNMDINSLRDESSPINNAIDKVYEGLEESFRNPLLKMNPFARRQLKRETREASALLRECGREKIRRRRETIARGDYVPEDFLSYIIKCQENSTANSKESEEIGIDMFISFFLAGHEPTANTLSFALMELGRHPEIFAKLRKEVDKVIGERSEVDFNDLNQLTYCDLVIKETLRLYPPAALTSREVNRDGFKIGVYDIPKGTRITVGTFVSSRLEKFNRDALIFKPERFLDSATKPSAFTTYPFTLGPRSCIGQNFAKMEVKVILSKFVQRFDMQLDPTQSFDFVDTAGLRPKDGVRATLTHRKSPINR